MNREGRGITRRGFLGLLAGVATGSALRASPVAGPVPIRRRIRSSGEQIPVIGMGSWITFNVGADEHKRAVRAEVLRAFFDHGGTLIDSSPMYGSSEEVIGHCLARTGRREAAFAATKVWTRGRDYGIAQMSESEQLWGVDRIGLMQIHNLLDWQVHLKTLRDWKAEGRVRYLGITTSHGRRHDLFERVMSEEPLDFVQFTYNIVDREAEQRLLPLAAERGIAVIVNRPFRGGELFTRVAGRPLPAWAPDIDCENWAQFFLRFICSHSAVTCVIPATSRVDHMTENMGALSGRLPDAATRERMVRYLEEM
jgi:aryl-alcohol dehydrogenase-like predicted oxidoreductase